MACMAARCNELVDGGVSSVGGGVQRQRWGSHSGSCVNSGLCFCPSRTIRGNDGDGGGGGGYRAGGVTVGGCRGEGADVKDGSVADSARERDRLEGVHFVVRGVQLEIRSRN